MSQLIETIQIINGLPSNLKWHNIRFNESRFKLFGILNEVDLREQIVVPVEYKASEVKCRIRYSKDIESIEFEPYNFRPVNSLKLVNGDSVSYDFKFSDRSSLIQLHLQRGEYDDIIIVKNEFIKDSSYTNLVFREGQNYFTPASPLLQGTKRAKLLSESLIQEKEIKVSTIKDFEEVHLINAFLDLGRCVIPCNRIF